MNGVCKEKVKDGSFRGHECGRKAKGVSAEDGRPLCGIHMRAEKRNAEAKERWRKEWDEHSSFKAEVEKQAENAGIKVRITMCGGDRVVALDKATFDMLLEAYVKGKNDNV